MVTVLIVDDETLTRSGLSMILRADGTITVLDAVDGVNAVECADRLQPDVVLLDIRMPGTSGLDILRILMSRPDPLTVAMLTTFDSDDFLTEALRIGAAGFLVKNTDPDVLIQMIHVLAAGGTVFAPGVNRKVLVAGIRDLEACSKIALLTDRERAVLQLVARGAANAEISKELRLGLSTVKDDLRSVFSKLEVDSRVRAALTATRAGMTS